MDLIILNDGLYQLIPVTKQIMEGIVITAEIDCFDLCDILRLKLTGYADTLNLHIMNDGSGSFMGCMCRYPTTLPSFHSISGRPSVYFFPSKVNTCFLFEFDS